VAQGAPSGISKIAGRVTPGLVDIDTNLSYEAEVGAGTGMVLTSTGEVLTNNHVIEGATSISVTDLGNSKTYTAHVVGYDAVADVAVLQLNSASGLATITPSKANAVVGQAIVALGNAGGIGGAPSTAGGSVTALNQSVTASVDGTGVDAEHLTGLIETNANIQPGDSGGPLVGANSQVLGMDTAAQTTGISGSVTTQAYAIPISTALRIVSQITHGDGSSTVHIGRTGFIGVRIESPSADMFRPSAVPTSGALITQVIPGSPASSIGLVPGDVITAINHTPVTQPSDISATLYTLHPGDSITLTWTAPSGSVRTAAFTLASGPPAWALWNLIEQAIIPPSALP